MFRKWKNLPTVLRFDIHTIRLTRKLSNSCQIMPYIIHGVSLSTKDIEKEGLSKLRVVWYQAGRYRSTHTCHSIGDYDGMTSERKI